jgi:hypothetical protein
VPPKKPLFRLLSGKHEWSLKRRTFFARASQQPMTGFNVEKN